MIKGKRLWMSMFMMSFVLFGASKVHAQVFTVKSGYVFNIDNETTFTLGRFYNEADGTLQGSGTLNVTGGVAFSNAGIVKPGTSPGILNITGDFSQTPTGFLDIELGSTTAGTGYDQLNISGSAALGGTLNVSTINGFVPSSGDSFQILKYSSSNGSFTTTNLPTLASGLVWDTVTSPNSITLSVCIYSISHTSDSFDFNIGTGSVSVTAGSGCSWTATSSDTSWLSISSGSSGIGNGTVNYAITANTDSSTRIAILTIAGESFTVTQTGTCAYSITPTSDSFDLNSSTGSVSVTAKIGCDWTATSSDTSWLSIIQGSGGTGDGRVNYYVNANTGSSTRIATLTIAGLTFTVTQTGTCAYSISPTSNSFDLNIGTGSVSVTAGSGCSWTATSSDASWLTIIQDSSGTGDGGVNYSVTANTGSSTRTGTLTIAGESFTVTQTGTTACTYSISPTSNSFDLNSGTGSVSVTAESECDWTASTGETWINITYGSSGNSGDGIVYYSVSVNTGTSRTGTITIAGEAFAVTQSGDAALPAPTNFSSSIDCTTSLFGASCSLLLSWDEMKDVSGYKLYYGFSSASYEGSIDLSNVTSQTFSDIPEGTYYLALTTYDSSGNESSKSDELAVTINKSPVPINFSATTSNCTDSFETISCTVTFNWTNVVGASGCYLHYGFSSGNYKGTIDVGDGETVTFNFITEGLYYLALTSYDSYGEESGYSDELVLEINNSDVGLPAPNNITTLVNNCSSGESITCTVVISWDKVDGVSGYNLYYGLLSDDYEGSIDITTLIEDLGSRTLANITGVPAGTYYVRITAYGSDGVESNYSEEVVLEVSSTGKSGN